MKEKEKVDFDEAKVTSMLVGNNEHAGTFASIVITSEEKCVLWGTEKYPDLAIGIRK